MNAQMKILMMLEKLEKRLTAIEEHLQSRDEQMIDSRTASRLLGITTQALRMRSRRGSIPCVKDKTGHILYRRSDITKLLIN